MHILIIEDDTEIARLTAMYLQSDGYQTSIIDDGNEAVSAIKTRSPDLVLLDLMLPGTDGFTICQQARTFYRGPILVLTAREDDMSEVSLLKLGADDYVRKPVKPHILSARIEALQRRIKPNTSDASVDTAIESSGQITLDEQRLTAILNGAVIQLTSAEFDLLSVLVQHAGTPVSREMCIQQLRGIDYDITDRSIDMRISGLRKKLGDTKAPYQRIQTIRHKGYLLINE